MDELIILLIRWIAGKFGDKPESEKPMSDDDIRKMQEVRRRMSEAARKNDPTRRVPGLPPQQSQRQPTPPRAQPSRVVQTKRPTPPPRVVRIPAPPPRRPVARPVPQVVAQQPPSIEPEEQPIPTAPPVARQPVQPTPAAKSPQVNAATLRRWLTPATLNKQFILTEVLQQPVALRESRF